MEADSSKESREKSAVKTRTQMAEEFFCLLEGTEIEFKAGMQLTQRNRCTGKKEEVLKQLNKLGPQLKWTSVAKVS